MKRLILAGCVLLLGGGLAVSQNTARPTPKLEAIAETKLVMEGLALANFRGLEKILKQKPADDQSWLFARGQALLLAESGNLMMLRPPKTEGQSAWFDRAMELRSNATQLALNIARRDIDRSRAALVVVANSCNRCHQAFKVNVQISPFEDLPPPVKAE